VNPRGGHSTDRRLATTWPAAAAHGTLADARGGRALTALIGGVAARLVRLWGLVSLPAPLHRVRVLTPEAPTREAASGALAGLPGLVWLDDTEWFSLPDRHSRLASSRRRRCCWRRRSSACA
jgi:hypothetical protein